MTHTQIGDITEYKFVVYCLEHNIAISKPVSNNLPYDFIIDINEQLLKVQVKTGYDAPTPNTFMFNTRSTSKNYTEVTTKDYVDKIDGFITYYNKLPNKFFYIPINVATKGTMVMYYGDAPKANQNNIKDFDFENYVIKEDMV